MTDSAAVSTRGADSESPTGHSEPLTKRRLIDSLITLAVAVALCGTQAVWMLFLGWAALHFLS